MFKKYPKIHRLGKEETDGVLLGEVHVEEKIDGANTQVWVEDGTIHCGSRNNTLCTDVDNIPEESDTFNGFLEYVRNSQEIRQLLQDNPNYRLYGEWLVRHTIHYQETAYQHFYLFDVEVEGEWLSKEKVRSVAEQYGIKTPEYHGVFTNPTTEQLMEFVGKSSIGENGEGVVLKNEEFINAFGDRQYAKIVTEKFIESNAITFGGNNRASETYWEMWVVHKYMTLCRVRKIMDKTQPVIDKRLDYEHTPRIANSAYHDMLVEEIWEIQKKAVALNFQRLKRIATKKAVQIYHDILKGATSIADNKL